ncbi:MAG TPA: hypothetical protein VFI00_13370 [Kribbella sp.]|nr:hypothetical protein [Kribbella sp.]
MKPLQAVAMGLVIVLLTVPVHGYDVLADPFGWVLVLVGLASLPVPVRDTLRRLAAVSLVVSVVVWVPAARHVLNVTDLALAWAAGHCWSWWRSCRRSCSVADSTPGTPPSGWPAACLCCC